MGMGGGPIGMMHYMAHDPELLRKLSKAMEDLRLEDMNVSENSTADAGEEEQQIPEPPQNLREAAKRGDEEAVQRFLAQPVNVDENGTRGETALHLAAAKGYKTTVMMLLEARADIEAEMATG